MWLPNTDAGAGLPLDGGDRRDYKIWQERHLQFMVTFGKAIDVCFCEANCDELENYIQVGRVQTGELGIARYSKDFDSYVIGSAEFAPIHAIQYVGKPGSIALYGGVVTPLWEERNPYDTVKMAREHS
jgi:hypothetical protein